MSRPATSLVGSAAERAARERARRRRHLTPLLDQAADDADAMRPPPVPRFVAEPEPAETAPAQPELAQPEPDGAEPGDTQTETDGAEPSAPADLPPLLAAAFDFLSHRLVGDYAVDEFGFDPALATSMYFPLLRPVYKHWFRVDVRGAENIPDHGAALLVSNHSGTLAWDALMTQFAVFDETPSDRIMRPLAADLVFSTPVMGDVARRVGATLASTDDAERLLAAGELVGVWPEGFKGIGKLYRDRYRLQRFGRGGFVSSAIRTGVPIIPVSVVGAEEIYPMIADLAPMARLMGTPFFPVTPTWPALGALGLIPMPSKWIIDFGTPIPTDSHRPSDADDPLVVLEITDNVREIIQRTLYALLVQRGPAFG